MRWAVLKFLELYQLLISPLYSPCCRFVPSCSQYAREAVERFGVIRGLCLAGGRFLRCHPFCAGGFDPVPETFALFCFRRIN